MSVYLQSLIKTPCFSIKIIYLEGCKSGCLRSIKSEDLAEKFKLSIERRVYLLIKDQTHEVIFLLMLYH